MNNVTGRSIGAIWLVVGVALLVWSFRALHSWTQSEYRFSGALSAVLIFASFAVVAVVGGALAAWRVRGGRAVLVVLSAATILYSASYILFGGFDDTGVIYALCVLALLVFAIATILLRKRI